MAVGQQKAFNRPSPAWMDHLSVSSCLLPYHAVKGGQQLWHTCLRRSDQLLPDWPPFTPLQAFWMQVLAVRPRRGKEVRPQEGCRPASIRHQHFGTRSSKPWVSFPVFFRATCFHQKLNRKCNPCKCCCQALNLHWQCYCHFIVLYDNIIIPPWYVGCERWALKQMNPSWGNCLLRW